MKYIQLLRKYFKRMRISLSDPQTKQCIPHFGGNHGPGYPLFIAIVWSLFNNSDYAVKIVQTILYGVSCVY